MNFHERRRLQAELSELDALLDQLPETQVIDRMSLQSRRDLIRAALDEPLTRQPSRAVLTFHGQPVVDSHGILAAFGGQAVRQFADTVAAFAAGSTGPLGARGSLPNREEYELLITGSAFGSFGFELEEYRPQESLPIDEPSRIERALEQAMSFLEATLGSDDALADAVSEAEPRAVESLRNFLEMVANADAACALEFNDRITRFRDANEVRRGAERLSRDNIREEDRWMEGSFQGVLPKSRRFEFRIAGTGEIIAGKVGMGIEDAGVINYVLDRPTRIRVLERRVGAGQPRYVLLEYQEPTMPPEDR